MFRSEISFGFRLYQELRERESVSSSQREEEEAAGRASPLAVPSGKVGGQGTPAQSRERRKMNQRHSEGKQPLSISVSVDWAAA